MLREKRVISLITVILMVAMLIPNVSFASVISPSMVDCWTDPGYYSTDWYTNNSDSDTYEISTAQELAGFAVLADGLNGESQVSFAGKTVILTSDIDLSSYVWVPIDITLTTYSGSLTFDGNNKTISGLKCDNIATIVDNYGGLFGKAKYLTVKNLNLENVRISLTTGPDTIAYAGAVLACGYDGVNITNCNVKSGSVSSIGYSGGIAGSTSSVSNCSNAAEVHGHKAGGIVGVSNSLSITDCYNSGYIYAYYMLDTTEDTDVPMAGGIVGCSTENTSILLKRCENTGFIEADESGVDCIAGGIAGTLRYQSGSLDDGMEFCSNSGSISSNSIAGGIVGSYILDAAFVISTSYNVGSISGEDFAGGIVGKIKINLDSSYYSNNYTLVYDCYSIGEISGSTSGGIMGEAVYTPSGGVLDEDTYVYDYCYYLDTSASVGIGESTGIVDKNLNGINTEVTSDDVSSGKLAYMLSFYYGQNIDNGKTVDAYPINVGYNNYDEHGEVYKATTIKCDGVTSKTTYSNTNYSSNQYTEPHNITYTAQDNVLTATCSACNTTGSATLDYNRWINSSNITYTGSEVMPMAVTYDDGWSDLGLNENLDISYKNNTDVGTATASITKDEVTASKEFTINAAIQDAPGSITWTSETYRGKCDGTIEGIDTTMEYRVGDSETYIPVTSTKMENLAAGDYFFRYKAKEGYAASYEMQAHIFEGSYIYIDTSNYSTHGYVEVDPNYDLEYGDEVTIKVIPSCGHCDISDLALMVGDQQVALDSDGIYKLTATENVAVKVITNDNRVAKKDKPTGLTGVKESIKDRNDGKITGVDETMEYRKDGESTYTSVNGTEITGLEPGTYYVRYKESDDYLASEDTAVIVEEETRDNYSVFIPIMPLFNVGYDIKCDKYWVNSGEDVTVTVVFALKLKPDENFRLLVNSVPVEIDENYQYVIKNVTENITLEATGSLLYPVTIGTPSDAQGYSITTDQDSYYNKDAATITFNILDGYEKTEDFAVYANDEQIQLDENNQYTIDSLPSDVTIRAEGIAKSGTTKATKSFKRYYGANRYDTSLEAAGAVKENLGVEKFDNVIITSGENFADALSGAYLAKLRNAPILGVNSATEARIQTYINKNLKADGTVYILGGIGAVSQKMEDALVKDGYTIKRLGGATRYDTNLEILKECEVSGADILVCSGTGYADSLSASAAGRPIMLVANEFSKDQQAYLSGITTGTMYIVGGVGAVNAGVEKAAASYGTTKRLGGATRYDTSVLVAEEFFSGNCDNLVLAYGQNFPDGLSGGPLALTLDAPLILTMNNDTVSQKAADFAAKKNVKFIAVLGGAPLISDATVQKILN